MKNAGFSFLEVSIALLFLSAFMAGSFELLHHAEKIEQIIQQRYQALGLLS